MMKILPFLEYQNRYLSIMKRYKVGEKLDWRRDKRGVYVSLHGGKYVYDSSEEMICPPKMGGKTLLFRGYHLKRDCTVKMIVAIKRQQLEGLAEELLLDMRRESKILRALMCVDCKYLAKVVDRFEENNFMYSIAEFVAREKGGVDLGHYIEERKDEGFLPSAAFRLLRHMLMGMYTLFLRGIVHRDLKPDNFVVGESSSSENVTLKLIDFGTSRTIKGGGKAMTFTGTEGWFPPEMFRVHPDVIKEFPLEEGESEYPPHDHSCDMHSLGQVFYKLMFNRFAFCASGGNYKQFLKKFKKTNWVPRGFELMELIGGLPLRKQVEKKRKSGKKPPHWKKGTEIKDSEKFLFLEMFRYDRKLECPWEERIKFLDLYYHPGLCTSEVLEAKREDYVFDVESEKEGFDDYKKLFPMLNKKTGVVIEKGITESGKFVFGIGEGYEKKWERLHDYYDNLLMDMRIAYSLIRAGIILENEMNNKLGAISMFTVAFGILRPFSKKYTQEIPPRCYLWIVQMFGPIKYLLRRRMEEEKGEEEKELEIHEILVQKVVRRKLLPVLSRLRQSGLKGVNDDDLIWLNWGKCLLEYLLPKISLEDERGSYYIYKKFVLKIKKILDFVADTRQKEEEEEEEVEGEDDD